MRKNNTKTPFSSKIKRKITEDINNEMTDDLLLAPILPPSSDYTFGTPLPPYTHTSNISFFNSNTK